MARTYQTPRKSTGCHFSAGQLAPRHQPEVEVEEDLEEVHQEDPVEQPQLYDGTILEADADGDLVILPAPEAADDAPPPLPVVPAPNPRYRGAEYHKHTTEDENGQFFVLLEEVLRHLGFTMKPLCHQEL
jgi:hypothetical protein